MSPAAGLPREKWLALSYDALREKNLALFRKLNAVLFPVAYSDKFYADCMAAGKVTQMGARSTARRRRAQCRAGLGGQRRAYPTSADPSAFRACLRFSHCCAPAAYTLPTDMLVGGIASRYERPAGGAAGGGATRLYIMSLGVLAPYRGRGVGQRLLVRALAEAQREGSAQEVYLHVQARCESGAAGLGRGALRRAAAAQVNNDDAIAFYKKFGFEARRADRLLRC